MSWAEDKNREPGEREFLVDDQQIDKAKLGDKLPYLGQKLEWDSAKKQPGTQMWLLSIIFQYNIIVDIFDSYI